MAKSIIQNDVSCYICGSHLYLHKHHIFGGTGRRKLSEQYGLWVYLREDWHNMSDYGVHYDKQLDLQLKQVAQEKFEETHTRAEFVRLFGRSYL